MPNGWCAKTDSWLTSSFFFLSLFYTQTHTQAHKHTQAHTSTHTHTHTLTHNHGHTHLCTNTQEHTHTFMHKDTRTLTDTHIHKHTLTLTHTQAHAFINIVSILFSSLSRSKIFSTSFHLLSSLSVFSCFLTLTNSQTHTNKNTHWLFLSLFLSFLSAFLIS